MISKVVCAFVRGQGAHSLFAAMNLPRFRNPPMRFKRGLIVNRRRRRRPRRMTHQLLQIIDVRA
jgi:hypothetical protein